MSEMFEFTIVTCIILQSLHKYISCAIYEIEIVEVVLFLKTVSFETVT